MLRESVSNNFLNALFGRAGAVTIGLNGTCYAGLGLASSVPSMNDSGEITGFSEPVGNNYARVRLGISGQSDTYMMSSADNAAIRNHEKEIHFHECLEGNWGEIAYIGLFSAETGGNPIMVGPVVNAQGEPATVTVSVNQVPLFRVDQLTAEITSDAFTVTEE